MKHSRSLLICALSLAAIAPGSASAEDTYSAVWKWSGDGQPRLLKLEMTSSELEATHQDQFNQGAAITDLETYVSASGQILYDAIWDNPQPDRQEIHRNLSLDELVNLYNSLTPNHHRLTDISSFRHPTKEGRRFTAVFDWTDHDDSTHALFTDLTRNEFTSTYFDQFNNHGRALKEYESYVSEDGVTRYVAVFGPIVGGGVFLYYSSTFSGFVQNLIALEQSGYGVQSFETTLQQDGSEHWELLGYPEPVFHEVIQGTRAEFLAWFSLLDQATLIDLEVVVDVPRPKCENYGAGWPGTNGVPSLTCLAPPALGQDWGLHLGNARGRPTVGVLQVGASPDNVNSGKGGTLLVDPFLTRILPIGSSGLDLTTRAPVNPSLAGVELFAQTILVDPGASHGLAFSPGLKITFGRWE